MVAQARAVVPPPITSSSPASFSSRLVLVERASFSYVYERFPEKSNTQSLLRFSGSAEAVRAALGRLPALLEAHGFRNEKNLSGEPPSEEWQLPQGYWPQDHRDWKGVWFRENGPNVFVYARMMQEERAGATGSVLAVANVPPELEAALREALL